MVLEKYQHLMLARISKIYHNNLMRAQDLDLLNFDLLKLEMNKLLFVHKSASLPLYDFVQSGTDD